MSMLQTSPSSGMPALRPKIAADAEPIAAGVVLVDPAGMVLFLRRADSEKNFAGYWCLPGGGIDEGESPEAAARRECEEETGHNLSNAMLREIKQARTGTGGVFLTFLALTDRFIPQLVDNEHVAYAWAPVSGPPEPLHPGVRDMLSAVKSSTPEFKLRADPALRDGASTLAMDRDSVRETDRDGRMRVAVSNIARACVSPYKGHEIPNWRALGLEPNKIYMMLRDPEELAKAAPSFNGIQILREHKPVTASDAQLWDVIGATGTEAAFDGEHMTNSLSFWTREATDDIESENKRELSPAYHYRPDMTAGEFAGERYDGVMRDIVGNHVALVRKGRQGPDVVVGDSGEEIKMSAIKALAKRTVSFTALHSFLNPHLAMDADITLAPVFKGVKNFKASQPQIIEGIKAAVAGKLKNPTMALDDGLKKLLSALEDGEVSEKEVDEVENAEAESAAKEAPPEEAFGGGEPEGEKKDDPASPVVEDESAALTEFLNSKGMSPEDIATACSFMPKKAAAEDVDPDAEVDPTISKDNLPPKMGGLPDPAIAGAKDADMKDMITKPAMDAAIEKAKAEVRATERAINAAVREVAPYVGDIGMAFDSADDVYRHALTALGVADAAKLDGHALKVVLGYQRKAGARAAEKADPHMAMDAKSISDFDARFPGASRIQPA